MAKPGAGKRQMQAVRKKQWNRTKKDLKATGKIFGIGKKKRKKKKGCYIATCVYGSYDCPEVWILRRFRDYTLDKTWYGKLFITLYYTCSPTIVRLFGNKEWFRAFCCKKLDIIVSNLKQKGISDTKYVD